MNHYKVGDLVEIDDALIVTDEDGDAHIITSETVLQIDEVSEGCVTLHDHFKDFGRFVVRQNEIGPSVMTCF